MRRGRELLRTRRSSTLLKSRYDQARIPRNLGALQGDIERVVAAKIKAGVTQDQLAELAGMDRAHLYRLESGQQSMTLRTLKHLADTLGVRVRDLIGEL
jgi:DNA-binding XRE family transcriptional regulator